MLQATSIQLIKEKTLVDVLGKSEEIKVLTNELNRYLLARFTQIFGAKNPLQGVINCGFIEKRQNKLIDLFAKGDELVSSKSEDVQKAWKKDREYLYSFVNNEETRKALKDARLALKDAAAEFEDLMHF